VLRLFDSRRGRIFWLRRAPSSSADRDDELVMTDGWSWSVWCLGLPAFGLSQLARSTHDVRHVQRPSLPPCWLVNIYMMYGRVVYISMWWLMWYARRRALISADSRTCRRSLRQITLDALRPTHAPTLCVPPTTGRFYSRWHPWRSVGLPSLFEFGVYFLLIGPGRLLSL